MPTPLLLNLEQTWGMVQNYTANLKHAPWSLQSSRSLPSFLKAEWKQVLSGMVVNLDTFFSGWSPHLLMIELLPPSEILTSLLVEESPQSSSRHMGTGLLSGILLLLQSSVPLPTIHLKYNVTPSIFSNFSEPFHTHTPRSSTLNSPILASSVTSRPTTSKMTGQETIMVLRKRKRAPNPVTNPAKAADSGTVCNQHASECCYHHLCSNCHANHPSLECPKKDGHKH